MKTIRIWLAGLILALMVSGSGGAETRGVGPSTGTDQPPAPVEIRVPVVPGPEPEDEVEVEPEGMTLSEAVTHAMEHSPDLALAQIRADIARISYYIAHEGGAAGSGWGGIELPPEFGWPDDWLTPEQRHSLVRQAESNYKIATLAVDHTRSMIALQTEVLFSGVLRLGRTVTVAEDAVDIAGRHLAMASVLRDTGLVTGQDVLEAKAGLEDARSQLEATMGMERQAIASLNRVLGRDLDAPVALVDTLDDTPAPPPGTDLATMEQWAVSKRFEVRRAQETRDLRQHEYDRLPQQVGGLSRDLTRLQLEQAELELAVEELTVRLEVRDAVRDLDDAYARVNSTRMGKLVAGEQLRLIELRYEYGMATGLELALARLNHTRARTAFIDACYDYQTARSRLRVFTGARL